MAVALDTAQEAAVGMALSAPLSIITGPPGTGKTTVTSEVIRRARAADSSAEVLLAAPTGRAARRLGEVTGCGACTIHRLLEYHPAVGFRRNGDNPLEGDLLILDEMSMADVQLMAHLADAVPERMRVVMVGDADQLPPVGPGAPFQDLARSGAVPVARLERVYRQDAGSVIPVNAARINAGRVPVVEAGNPAFALRVYPRGARDRMADDVLQAVEALLADGYAADDIQVLVPMRRGPLGTEELNRRLQDLLNRRGRGAGVLECGSKEFRVGDRVMHLVNNYGKGVFNGELGVVTAVRDIAVRDPLTGRERPVRGLAVAYDDGMSVREVDYTAEEARAELSLAYACTVHKSQGGEFPAVVMALGWDAYLLLARNLVYTGITRARERLVLLAEEGALERAVRVESAASRNSSLAERLGVCNC